MPVWLHVLARSAGVAWTLPNSMIGLLLGTAGMVRGARVHFSPRDHAVVFSRWPWGPGGAITFGNTIVHTGQSLDRRCHTYAHQAGWRVEPQVRLGDH